MRLRYVYHIALKKDWEKASKTDFYKISTRGKSLHEVGFIHLAFRHQTRGVLRELYEDLPLDDLIILKISTTELVNDLKIEKVGGKRYPHYYGALDVRQVKKVSPAKVTRLWISPSLRTNRDDRRSRRVWHA